MEIIRYLEENGFKRTLRSRFLGMNELKKTVFPYAKKPDGEREKFIIEYRARFFDESLRLKSEAYERGKDLKSFFFRKPFFERELIIPENKISKRKITTFTRGSKREATEYLVQQL